ncbi:extracellular solute-binding protein [Amnibacterium kyonggiense]
MTGTSNRMRLTRRGLLGAGMAAFAAPMLAACASPAVAGLSGGQLDPRTLIYWNLFGGGDGSRMETMEAQYQRTHGGPSSLQSTVFAWGNPYYSKLTLATVGDKPPDVAISHLTRAKNLALADVIEPITDADLALVGLSSADFNPKAWAAQRLNGDNIAVPLDTHPIVMFYNVDVCRKAGLTASDGALKPIHGMAEFESALKAVSKVTGGVAATLANVAETATPWRFFTTLYHQHADASPVLSDDGARFTIDDGIALDVMDRVASWVKQGWMNDALNYADAETDLFTGRTGFYFEGEWEITTAQGIKGLRFGMVPIPTLYDKAAAQADSHTFVLPKKDRTPAQRRQAMGFIKSMLDQSMTWAQGGHIPAYLPVRESAAYARLEPQADYASAANNAIYDDPAWYSGSGSTFEGIIGAQLALAQQRAVTPRAALAATRSQLQVYLHTPSPL